MSAYARTIDFAEIALRAVYEAGAAGNVRCRAAVAEMERLRRQAAPPPFPPAPDPLSAAKPIDTASPCPRPT